MDKETLLSLLPHGSGINGEWTIEERKKDFRASNFYDTMTESGMYDTPADFYIVVPKDDPLAFKLHFQGQLAQYLNRKYMLREYLDDTITGGLRGE